jgi:integrase/recombinase XerD
MPTLAQVAMEFIERPYLASSTKRSYEVTLSPLLAEVGYLTLEIMTREVIESYLVNLNSLAYTTQQRHLTIIQSLFNFAVQKGYLKVNPIARLSRPKPNPFKGEHGSDEVIHYLTPEQLKVLYQLVSDDTRLHCLVLLLHQTGARISELLALNLGDIDREHYKFQVVGKGNKIRWCFYSQNAALILDKYLKYYRYEPHLALFTAQHPLTLTVTRLSYSRVYHLWKELTRQHPLLEGIRLHDLRHTFATERVGLMGIEELRALMGHNSIQTTLKYQKVTSSRAEEVAKNALQFLTNNEI